jgi:hypothetical protein
MLSTRREDEAAREKARNRARAARERQIQRQREKMQDPAHRQAMYEKKAKQQQAARARQLEKQKAKQAKPVEIKRSAPKVKKPKSTRGMKGRTPTAQEKRLADKIAQLGCVACAQMGIDNPVISLHHVHGRTKPLAHAKQLPLCAHHHDTPLTKEEQTMAQAKHGRPIIPVHAKGAFGGKAAFEAEYGTQAALLALVYEKIGEAMPWCANSSEHLD